MSEYRSISSKRVKIRKPHRCHGCNDQHSIGDIMECTVGIQEGSMQSTYWCTICDDYIEQKVNFWRDYEDGIYPGDLVQDEEYLQFKAQVNARNQRSQTDIQS